MYFDTSRYLSYVVSVGLSFVPYLYPFPREQFEHFDKYTKFDLVCQLKFLIHDLLIIQYMLARYITLHCVFLSRYWQVRVPQLSYRVLFLTDITLFLFMPTNIYVAHD